jgi:hypothetical protein
MQHFGEKFRSLDKVMAACSERAGKILAGLERGESVNELWVDIENDLESLKELHSVMSLTVQVYYECSEEFT